MIETIANSKNDEMAQSEASEAINDIPDRAKRLARTWFHNAASLSPEVLDEFLSYYARSLSEGTTPTEIEKLAERTKTEVSQAQSILTAVSVVVGALGLEKVSVDELLTVGRGVLFDDADRPVVDLVIERFTANSSVWKQNFQHRALASRTLPSLTDCQISVDLRLRFKSQEIVDAVAVALVYIDTDSANQSLWFQMTRGDARRLIDRLDRALQQMDAAEKLYAKAR